MNREKRLRHEPIWGARARCARMSASVLWKLPHAKTNKHAHIAKHERSGFALTNVTRGLCPNKHQVKHKLHTSAHSIIHTHTHTTHVSMLAYDIASFLFARSANTHGKTKPNRKQKKDRHKLFFHIYMTHTHRTKKKIQTVRNRGRSVACIMRVMYRTCIPLPSNQKTTLVSYK